MSQKPSASGSGQAKPPKEQWFGVRIDADLRKQAQKKAEQRGWKLGAVIRVLLRRWLQEDEDSEDSLTKEEMAEELKRAPKALRNKPTRRQRKR